MKADLRRVRPYGDTFGDGMVQMCFSLPLPFGDEAREAARQLAVKMGLVDPQVVYSADEGEGFTFITLYGKCQHTIDATKIQVVKVEAPNLGFDEINEMIRTAIGRKIVVLGACTGTDAHTVGIDAIMNMKGYAGEYGLERYPMIDAYNLGAQVENEDLLAKAIELQADAILVSQVVTQKDVHLPNLTQLAEILEAEGLRSKIVLLCGGPRINHELALELGYDAGFGPGTLATEVAAYVVREIAERQRKNT